MMIIVKIFISVITKINIGKSVITITNNEDENNNN